MMDWSALTKKQQQMVIITVILAVGQIVLMAHFLGWTKPAAARGGSAKKELLELGQKLDDARLILKREEPIRRELAQSIEKLEKLTVHSPTFSDRYAWAYEYVSRCSTQSRVELDSLEEIFYMGDDKEKSEALPYEISVSTRCGYNSLVEFLWRLEKDNPLLRIKEVTVSALRDQNLSHQVRIIIQWPASVKIERGNP
ncbi:MAG: hypothetical protein WC047_01265 [Kiritimatiellales bacterium]